MAGTETLAISWLGHGGYIIMFILMLIEGPAITMLGAFAAKLGYFSLWWVLILSILGNFIPDIMYYAMGFWGRTTLVDKYGKYLKLTPERIESLERNYNEHMGKTLMAVKLLPLIATPGLIIAGIVRLPFKKYMWWSLAVILPSSLIYLAIGYYFGAAYDRIGRYFDLGGYTVLIVIGLAFFASWLYKKFTKQVAEKIKSF